MTGCVAEMRERARRAGGAGAFSGLSFALTGLGDGARREVAAAVQRQGGLLLQDLYVPHPLAPMAAGRAGKRRSSIPATARGLDVLVADAERRTPKFLKAVAMGCPVLTPAWIKVCLWGGREKGLMPAAAGRVGCLLPTMQRLC